VDRFVDSPPNADKYALLLGQSLLTGGNVNSLFRTPVRSKIGGLLLAPDTPDSFSPYAEVLLSNAPESLRALDPNPDRAWLPAGVGSPLLWEDLRVPIVLVEEEDMPLLQRYALENARLSNLQVPTFQAKMDYYFGPQDSSSSNSETCLAWTNIYGDRYPQCDPIGGQSVWASTINPTTLAENQSPIVLVTSAFDANGIFHYQASGANAGASSIVALLAAAEALRPFTDPQRTDT
jgi:nicastrin